MRVVGAVLIGGASRRMGQDKALIEVDGVPMARLVADALQNGGADRVVLVGGNAAVAAELWLDPVPDRWVAIGPLGGIASAVIEAGETVHRADPLVPMEQVAVAIAACDQPALGASLIASLVAALKASPPEVVVAVPVTPDGRRQPFPTVWRASAGHLLEQLIAGGARRADAGIGLENAVTVDATADEIRDVDTPAELAEEVGGLPWVPPDRPAGPPPVVFAPPSPPAEPPPAPPSDDAAAPEDEPPTRGPDVGPALVWDPPATEA